VTPPVDRDAAFRRALAAEPQLRTINRVVNTLVALAPTSSSGRPFCHGCAWVFIVKPLAAPWIGWERGYPADQATDPDPDGPAWSVVRASGITIPPKSEPTSDTEKWLRTSEAWDAVTDTWIGRLVAADPGNGHGLLIGKDTP
jgi:hypothetical protein